MNNRDNRRERYLLIVFICFNTNSGVRSQNPEDGMDNVKCILTAGTGVNVYRLSADGKSRAFAMHERHIAFTRAMPVKCVDRFLKRWV